MPSQNYLNLDTADFRYQGLGQIGGVIPASVDPADNGNGLGGGSRAIARSDHDHPWENAAWADWTPRVFQGGGEVPSTINYARYKKFGKTVYFYARITMGPLPTTPAVAGQVIRIHGMPDDWLSPNANITYGGGYWFDITVPNYTPFAPFPVAIPHSSNPDGGYIMLGVVNVPYADIIVGALGNTGSPNAAAIGLNDVLSFFAVVELA